MLFIMQLFVVVIAFLLNTVRYNYDSDFIYYAAFFQLLLLYFIVTVCCYHCDNYLFLFEIEHELHFSDPQLWVIQIHPGQISAL